MRKPARGKGVTLKLGGYGLAHARGLPLLNDDK